MTVTKIIRTSTSSTVIRGDQSRFCLPGMEEASCERASYVSSYQNHTDAFTVIQGPAARIRPSRLPDDFFSCESADPPPRLPSLPAGAFVTSPPPRVLSLLSRLRGPGEEPVGMPAIPT